ncbi:restriction endonuclease subunit S [Deltaproteobacteria bacterium]|nr:restriction endonuclease subunit S [Deltaproteobacteria bacterium]
MEVKEGYKQTEVGIIPEDWELVSLDSICSVTSGKRLPYGYYLTESETPYPYIRVSDMHPGGIITDAIRYVPLEAFPSISQYRIFKEDLFISVAGTIGLIGKIPEFLNGANLTENANRISKIKCEQDYLLYVLLSPIVRNIIDSFQTVGAQPKLALTRIRKFKIPLPLSKKEQTAISTALSDVDTLMDKLDRLIRKKRYLKKAAMQQLLYGETRLPGFDGDWELLNMGKSSYLKARIGWQGLTKSEYLEYGDYCLVTGTDFSEGKINWDGCHFVEKHRYDQDRYIQLKIGDVLITKDGTIGKAAYVDTLPFPATLNSGVFVIRPLNDDYVPKFFLYILVSRIFKDFLNKLAAGSTISHLYQKDFIGFEFLVPPTKEEQFAIAEVLSEMDDEINILEKRRTKTADLKQAMMQELLTGKTRLVEAGATHA